jgi:hypothetical protein
MSAEGANFRGGTQVKQLLQRGRIYIRKEECYVQNFNPREQVTSSHYYCHSLWPEFFILLSLILTITSEPSRITFNQIGSKAATMGSLQEYIVSLKLPGFLSFLIFITAKRPSAGRTVKGFLTHVNQLNYILTGVDQKEQNLGNEPFSISSPLGG